MEEQPQEQQPQEQQLQVQQVPVVPEETEEQKQEERSELSMTYVIGGLIVLGVLSGGLYWYFSKPKTPSPLLPAV